MKKNLLIFFGNLVLIRVTALLLLLPCICLSANKILPGADTKQNINILGEGLYDVTNTENNGCAITVSAKMNQCAEYIASVSEKTHATLIHYLFGITFVNTSAGPFPLTDYPENGPQYGDILSSLYPGIFYACISINQENYVIRKDY